MDGKNCEERDSTIVYTVFESKPSKISFEQVEKISHFFTTIYGFLNRETLVEILEDFSLAYHLWNKFSVDYGRNAQWFYDNLDSINKRKIIDWYNRYIGVENTE